MAKRVIASKTPDLKQKFSGQLLGQAIKAKRTQSGLSQEDVALMCGISKTTLVKVENGTEEILLSSLLRITRALGVNLFIEEWSNGADEWSEWN